MSSAPWQLRCRTRGTTGRQKNVGPSAAWMPIRSVNWTDVQCAVKRRAEPATGSLIVESRNGRGRRQADSTCRPHRGLLMANPRSRYDLGSRRPAISDNTRRRQIWRSSRGFQNGRKSSIFGHRFITTFNPASSASLAARSSKTPICPHNTLAPIAMAFFAIP